jgi:hypothetical protein
MMAKLRFGERYGAYVAGGFLLRRVGSLQFKGLRTEQELPSGNFIITPLNYSEEFEDGPFGAITFGVGFAFRTGRLRLLPELRYAGWIERGSDPRFERNQAEFLLGFLF